MIASISAAEGMELDVGMKDGVGQDKVQGGVRGSGLAQASIVDHDVREPNPRSHFIPPVTP